MDKKLMTHINNIFDAKMIELDTQEFLARSSDDITNDFHDFICEMKNLIEEL